MVVIRGFSKIFAFGGRDTRGEFWPYAGVVVMLVALGSALAVLPVIGRTMTRMQQFARSHPDHAEITQGPSGVSIQIHGNHPELMPDFGVAMVAMGIVVGLAVVLLAAAVVRRLRDAGVSPRWGALPVPFMLFGLVAMHHLTAARQAPDVRLFLLLFANNALYLASLVLLIMLLCRPTRRARRMM